MLTDVPWRSQQGSFLAPLVILCFAAVIQVAEFPVAGAGNVASHDGHDCIHDQVMKTTKPTYHRHGFRRQYNWDRPSTRRNVVQDLPLSNLSAPIRILFDTSLLEHEADPYGCYSVGQLVMTQYGNQFKCRSQDLITPAMASWVKNIALPAAQRQLEAVIRTNPVVGNFSWDNRDNGTICWSYPLMKSASVPEKYWETNGGVAGVDLLVIVSARPVPSQCALLADIDVPESCKVIDSSVMAFAGACHYELKTNRPLAGFFNYNPALMDKQEIAGGTINRKSLGTTLHEITHVLGFSSDRFQYFKWPGQANGTKTVAADSYGNNVIQSPTVVSVVREHFNCPSLAGAILEDAGANGTTAGSHWKKLYYGNEYMTGEASAFPIFSRITLALLQDSGWWMPDFTSPYVQSLQWGLNMGCSFATGGCRGRPGLPYVCTELTQTGCTVDRTAKGRCSIPVSPSDSLSGTCYTLGEYTGSQCYLSNNALKQVFDAGEVYGDESRCFDSSLIAGVSVSTDETMRCYKTQCAGPTRLKIELHGMWYNCTPGTSVTPIGWGGALKCPDNYNLCNHVTEDPTWPELHSLEPSFGGPGQMVTLHGSGFTEGMTVHIGAPVESVKVESSTKAVVVIASTDNFREPTYLIAQETSVFVTTPNGRSAVGVGSYKLQVPVDAAYLNSIFTYFGQYPLYTGLVCVAIVFIIALSVFYCFRERRRALYGQGLMKEQNQGDYEYRD